MTTVAFGLKNDKAASAVLHFINDQKLASPLRVTINWSTFTVAIALLIKTLAAYACGCELHEGFTGDGKGRRILFTCFASKALNPSARQIIIKFVFDWLSDIL